MIRNTVGIIAAFFLAAFLLGFEEGRKFHEQQRKVACR